MPHRAGGDHDLRGRQRECAALAQLVADARAGTSGALVVTGEAGIGKTALLEHVRRSSSGCRIVDAVGAETEVELAYAGLHQVCAPFLGQLGTLAAPQAAALSTAFGLSEGPPPDRFLVGLAALSLFATAAETEPLVFVIDDAQWLDQVSIDSLGFVARRLMAERVAIVFAVRTADPFADGAAIPPALSGLPVLTLGGLRDADARDLLASAVPGRLDEAVRDRIVAEARGNPLALLELPRSLPLDDRAGGFERPDVVLAESQLARTFTERVRALPASTQQLLMLAAAEPLGDAGLVWRAADRLGIPRDAAGPAEAAGLIELGVRVRFRHPLVRSAAYGAAEAPARRAAHRALADAMAPHGDPDRRVWHLALATDRPDEGVAAELGRSATRAEQRGGVAAAAAFLERATELTPDLTIRGERALAAANARFRAGGTDRARDLLAIADASPMDAASRARIGRLRAQISIASEGVDAVSVLLDAARALEPLDAAAARETYLEAMGAAFFAGRLGAPRDLVGAAAAALALPRPASPRAVDLLLEGIATRLVDGYAAGVPVLTRALAALRMDSAGANDAVMSWLWMACPVAPEPVAPDLWDEAGWAALATRAVSLARASGALSVLPTALAYRAGVHVHMGEFAAAARLVEEASALATTAGTTPLRYTALLVTAWRGDETAASAAIDTAITEARTYGEGRALGLAHCAIAILCNGRGRYADALAAAQIACQYEDVGFYGTALTELVEAAARVGEPGAAAAAADELVARTRASGTDWALGVGRRTEALFAADGRADELFGESVAALVQTKAAPDLARTRLLYGEWLRREGERARARGQLRAAYEMFDGMGAAAFAERARRELSATGETVRTRARGAPAPLTPQEAQIARLAGEGLTNPEIGAELFLSPHTVEWHLRKVFTKLGISSRRQLRSRSMRERLDVS